MEHDQGLWRLAPSNRKNCVLSVASIRVLKNECPCERIITCLNHAYLKPLVDIAENLSTAIVYVLTRNKFRVPARELIDSGAQMTLISERLAQQLHLPREAMHMPIAGIGTSVSQVESHVLTKLISFNSSFECVLHFMVLPKLFPRLPSVSVIVNEWNIANNIKLADPQFNVSSEIDLMLGAEIFFKPNIRRTYNIGVKFTNLPINTHLGWVVSGIHIPTKHALPIVRLPKKLSLLGDSRDIAWRRFKALERRFTREPDTK
uniref:Peptidase A2 domain-containing protein n=1 Tax=Anopheles funestus TaxID=62324 RepID=A0A182R2X9_ANOFN